MWCDALPEWWKEVLQLDITGIIYKEPLINLISQANKIPSTVYYVLISDDTWVLPNCEKWERELGCEIDYEDYLKYFFNAFVVQIKHELKGNNNSQYQTLTGPMRFAKCTNPTR